MFKRRYDVKGPTVTVTIEDKEITVPASETVAAALLAEGFAYTRTTPVSGALRTPYCLMGTCFDCLVEIDGIPNRQACQTRVRDGMRIKIQKGARDIES